MAESRFTPPDTMKIVESWGLDKRIISVSNGIITFDCGGKYKGKQLICTFDPVTGMIVDRIPKKLIMDRPEKYRKDVFDKWKRFSGIDSIDEVEYIDVVLWASYPCDVTVTSSSNFSKKRGFEYSYLLRTLTESNRALDALVVLSADFIDVMEPRDSKLCTRSEDVRYSLERKSEDNFCIIVDEFPYFAKPGRKIDDIGTCFRRFFSDVKPQKMDLQPGEESTYQLLSHLPPGTVRSKCYCKWGKVSGITTCSKIGEGMTTVFGVPMHTWVVGPRRDLERLNPRARLEKLVEELRRFEEAGWMDKKTYKNLRSELLAIGIREIPMEKAKTMVSGIRNNILSLEDSQCSIECHSILTINLELALRDLSGTELKHGSSGNK